MSKNALGIGIIGSGFNARFHLQAFVGVRDADVRGVWSPNEKHAAEAARLQMPVVANEAAAYGYEAEDRHFVRVFLKNEKPALTFEDGLEVVKLLMAGYLSAELGRTIDFPPPGLDTFLPAVAQGTWKPKRW